VIETLVIANVGRAASELTEALARHGFDAVRPQHFSHAMELARRSEVVLLDLELSGVDAIALCRAIRATGGVPLIVLANGTKIEKRIEAFHAGADDYLARPYDIDEFRARFNAIRWRRNPASGVQATIRRGDVEINLVRQSVTIADVSVRLSRKELQILALIASEDGAVCSRERIIAETWGRPWPGAQETVNVHIATLRAKLKRPELIETVRGLGYRLAAASEHNQRRQLRRDRPG